jgi:hypothetical protein
VPAESFPHHDVATILIICGCSLIGLWGATLQAGEVDTLKTWLWIGLGLAGLYLLAAIANRVDQLDLDHRLLSIRPTVISREHHT